MSEPGAFDEFEPGEVEEVIAENMRNRVRRDAPPPPPPAVAPPATTAPAAAQPAPAALVEPPVAVWVTPTTLPPPPSAVHATLYYLRRNACLDLLVRFPVNIRISMYRAFERLCERALAGERRLARPRLVFAWTMRPEYVPINEDNPNWIRVANTRNGGPDPAREHFNVPFELNVSESTMQRRTYFLGNAARIQPALWLDIAGDIATTCGDQDEVDRFRARYAQLRTMENEIRTGARPPLVFQLPYEAENEEVARASASASASA